MPLGTGSQSIPSTPVREQVYLSDSRCGDQPDPARAAHKIIFLMEQNYDNAVMLRGFICKT